MVFFVHALRFRALVHLVTWSALAAGVGTVQLTAQELPPAIQADRLLLQAEQHIQANDYAAALASLDRILELRDEHGLEIPAAFWFNHARVAMQGGDPEQARTSAVRYLQLAGQDGEHYLPALELLNEAEALLAEAEAEARVARARAEAEARAARARAEAEARAARARAEAEARAAFRDCVRCPLMVRVPPGSFVMGSPASEADRSDDEGPRHTVVIEYPLAVGVFEVTFEEWDACSRAGGCGRFVPDDQGWGRGRRPVINVSWEDAQAYLSWLSRESGEEYRLLSEAEWEYVARAGTQTAWYWGRSASDGCRYANGRFPASCPNGYRFTAPVGSYEPNAFGLYDVSGNVWEWTEDCWNGSYAGAPADGGAWRSERCATRMLRGGAWYNNPDILRSALRDRLSPGYRSDNLGFRVARTLN